MDAEPDARSRRGLRAVYSLSVFKRLVSGYNRLMFFFLVCILIAVLMLSGRTPDAYGWMMLVGVGWLAGYLDCRRFAKSDQDTDRVMPPDAYEPIPNDNQAF